MITRFQTSGAIAGIVKWSCDVEDADGQPGEPEQDHDREQDLAEPDAEVVERRRELVAREERDDHRREQDEDDRDQRQRDQQQAGERRRELVGLALASSPPAAR